MVLVVDDHPDLLRVLLLMLRSDGFEAVGVSSGREALAFLQTRLPHCIILDHNMPGMSGLDVLTTLRADPRYNGVRVIMFSAQGIEMEEVALAAGADAYVQKDTLDWAKMRRALLPYCQPTTSPNPTPSREEMRDVG